MKKIILTCLFFLFLHSICIAGDFIVEFVEENYKETKSPVSYSPEIYHSIQVRSDAGPKVLVLKGNDYHYRRWLRQYIAQGRQFIVQIPDAQDDLFISSSAFEMNVANLHPFNLDLYRQGQRKSRTGKKSGIIKTNSYSSQTSGRNQPATEKNQLRQKQGQLEKERASQANRNKKKAALKEKKRLKNKKTKKRALEKEQQQKLQARKKTEYAKQYKAEFERKKLEQEKFFAGLTARRALDDQRRREEMEIRWQALKKRLLADKRLREMELEVRNQEIERRWLELKQRYGF